MLCFLVLKRMARRCRLTPSAIAFLSASSSSADHFFTTGYFGLRPFSTSRRMASARGGETKLGKTERPSGHESDNSPQFLLIPLSAFLRLWTVTPKLLPRRCQTHAAGFFYNVSGTGQTPL